MTVAAGSQCTGPSAEAAFGDCWVRNLSPAANVRSPQPCPAANGTNCRLLSEPRFKATPARYCERRRSKQGRSPTSRRCCRPATADSFARVPSPASPSAGCIGTKPGSIRICRLKCHDCIGGSRPTAGFCWAFEYVQGRHPDLSPDSPDLPAVAATLSTMAIALTPSPIPKVQAASVRWADRVAPEVVDGQTLVHTDVTPHNFLIHEGGMTVVDWSMPCRGAAWIDTALMVVRLVRAGHSPEQAEGWAGQILVWSTARPEGVDAFAVGVAALSRDRQRQRPSVTHLGPLAEPPRAGTTTATARSHEPMRSVMHSRPPKRVDIVRPASAS